MEKVIDKINIKEINALKKKIKLLANAVINNQFNADSINIFHTHYYKLCKEVEKIMGNEIYLKKDEEKFGKVIYYSYFYDAIREQEGIKTTDGSAYNINFIYH